MGPEAPPIPPAMVRSLIVCLFALLLAGPPGAGAATLPSGFVDTVVLSGLEGAANVEFSPDGRVFVAELTGLIKVYDSLDDPTPSTFADLSTNVHAFWDRGMLGLALDPAFPTRPYLYVLYTYDAAIGTAAPRWGTPGTVWDDCPTPPGATDDGCVVSARLSRLTASGNSMTGSEQVLIEDWCQQYPSHSIGDLAFGADGALYVSAGDAASFNFTDWGQDGSPPNPCGDPPLEGGALRSQDLRTAGDPVGLDGTILRIDPNTGAGLPGNPFAGSSDQNARRIVAYGMRNPFRFTVRPGTNEIWLGDVGYYTWEEINRITNPADGVADNFGWPCYEGTSKTADYDAANLPICEALYATSNGYVKPYYRYNHSKKVVSGESCPAGSSSISGMAFETTSSYPATYDGALFFADYSRKCIWAMLRGSNGLPDSGSRVTFVAGAPFPVDLEIGPGGDLFYVDAWGGAIHRIQYAGSNKPPEARATATPSYGAVPLMVQFDGTGSSDPDVGDSIAAYAWDLDGDGQYDDSTLAAPMSSYSTAGQVSVRLRVTDTHGATATTTIVISPGNTPPSVTLDAPVVGTTWKVGDTIQLAATATDVQDRTLAATAYSWTIIMHHCPSNCHEHQVKVLTGPTTSFVAPDHEYPSHLEVRLAVTDSGGLQTTASLLLQPQTVVMTFATSPPGLQLVVGGLAGTAPFNRTAIVGSANSVSASSPQTLGGTPYTFVSWSDGGAASHTIAAPAVPTTFTALFSGGGSGGGGGGTTFTPVADAYVKSDTPTSNFGTATSLRVRVGSQIVKSYLTFSVSGLTKAVSSAKLRLTVTDPGLGGSAYVVQDTTWGETSITYGSAPATSGQALSTLGSVAAGQVVEFDLGSAITGNGTFTIAVVGGGSDPVFYGSRESATRPQLVLTLAP
jgi:glucose/arabinose dehydrogenase